MIKWTKVLTKNNYPFLAYRTGKGYGKEIILSEYISEYSTQLTKSLTNNMEEVINHIVLGESFGGTDYTNIRFYQWGNDGLYEVIPYWVRKITRDMPPFKLDSIDWKFISKDLTAFELLYAK